MIQNTFKRYEIKFLVTKNQKALILHAMKPYMEIDQYGLTKIYNIYYDTDNYRLIRKSIEGPVYKEKLRLRTYQKANGDTPSFIEIKKKYDSVVYKRRVVYPYDHAVQYLESNQEGNRSQIDEEIKYFLSYYQDLKPKLYLTYDREAFFMKDGSDFRVTFDQNIEARLDNLSLKESSYGTNLIPKDMTLMEIKTPSSIPLWMTLVLSKNKIYKVSFSKYGKAYQDLIMNKGE